MLLFGVVIQYISIVPSGSQCGDTGRLTKPSVGDDLIITLIGGLAAELSGVSSTTAIEECRDDIFYLFNRIGPLFSSFAALLGSIYQSAVVAEHLLQTNTMALTMIAERLVDKKHLEQGEVLDLVKEMVAKELLPQKIYDQQARELYPADHPSAV